MKDWRITSFSRGFLKLGSQQFPGASYHLQTDLYESRPCNSLKVQVIRLYDCLRSYQW